MDYAALSPHVGSWALRDDVHGNSSIRGGAINWGSLGSRISSALGSTGRWLSNVGNRFLQSNTFQQIKQGVNDSGVIKNAATLAGDTVNSLLDIGRLKLQNDLENLRRKALGEQGPPNTAELQALIAALQSQLNGNAPQNNSTHTPTSTPIVPTTRPIPELVTEVRPNTSLPVVEPPVTSSSASVPSTLDLPPPRKRAKKRPRYSSWRSRLDSMKGSGVRTLTKRMCY